MSFTSPASGPVIYAIHCNADDGPGPNRPISWCFTDFNNTNVETRTIQGTCFRIAVASYQPGLLGDQVEFAGNIDRKISLRVQIEVLLGY